MKKFKKKETKQMSRKEVLKEEEMNEKRDKVEKAD